MSYLEMRKEMNATSGMFLRVKDGENRIRVVTEPLKIWKSFDKATKTAKVYVTEAGAAKDPEAKPRWMMYVINRDGNQLQVAEFGTQVMNQFLDIATSTEGFENVDALMFDFILIKKGQLMETEYTLQASRKETALTEEERIMLVKAKSIQEILQNDKAVVDGGDMSVPF